MLVDYDYDYDYDYEGEGRGQAEEERLPTDHADHTDKTRAITIRIYNLALFLIRVVCVFRGQPSLLPLRARWELRGNLLTSARSKGPTYPPNERHAPAIRGR
jgi:hypothetical protein